MAYGLSNLRFHLKEGLVKIGLWDNPQLIGTDLVDPISRFSGDIMGNFKQGTLNNMLNRQYVEAMSGTPGKKLRKDLIRKDFSLELQSFQYNTDLMALLRGLLTQPAYAVTTPSAASYDINWVGPDEPTQSTHGILVESALTDGTLFYIALWAGKLTTEDVGLTFPGTDYGLTNAKVESFVEEAFTGATADQKSYGAYFAKVA